MGQLYWFSASLVAAAQHMPPTVLRIEVNASHVAYMSYPKETVKLIEEAATSAHVNQ